jgi:hypothetical protein
MDVLRELFYPPCAQIFDPCPANPQQDGLSIKWKAWNFVNPPFREASKWIRKAHDEEKEKATVVLVPVRTSANWMHDIALPSAESVIIWINSVTFKPHIRPLPLAIMTFGIRCSPTTDRCPDGDVKLYPISLNHWSFPGSSTLNIEAVAKRTQETYHLKTIPDMTPSPWTQGMETTWAPEGTTVVCALGSPRSLILTAGAYVRQHPHATLILMILPLFNGAYFRSAAAVITDLVFIKPRPHLSLPVDDEGVTTHRPSMQGSVLVVMKGSEKRITDPPSRSYLGLWRNGVAFGSKTASKGRTNEEKKNVN